MKRIDTDRFLVFCKSLEGKRIPTQGGRSKFVFRVIENGLELRISTNKPRKIRRSEIDKIIEAFSESESPQNQQLRSHHPQFILCSSPDFQVP